MIAASFPSQASMQSFRAGLQQAVEAMFPGTLRFEGVDYDAAVMERQGPVETQDGGYVQALMLVAHVSKLALNESLIRDLATADKRVRRLKMVHVEKGITYELRQVIDDAPGPNWKLVLAESR